MVHRFIVRSEVISPATSRLVNHDISTDRWSAMITVAGFLGAILLSLLTPSDERQFGHYNTLAFLVMAGFGVVCAHCIGNVDQTSALHECIVSIYPIGIQIECVVRSSLSRKTDDEHRVTHRTRRRKPIFVPRETVIDCVVSEVVHSHKVGSKVLFRVGVGPKFHQSDVYVHLVDAFPGVEMTYEECLAMRAEINRYLLQEEVR
jgi:hypothetical protein